MKNTESPLMKDYKPCNLFEDKRFNFLQKKSPVYANGEMINGKPHYRPWATLKPVFYNTVYFVISKIDDSLLFESKNECQINGFLKTTRLS